MDEPRAVSGEKNGNLRRLSLSSFGVSHISIWMTNLFRANSFIMPAIVSNSCDSTSILMTSSVSATSTRLSTVVPRTTLSWPVSAATTLVAPRLRGLRWKSANVRSPSVAAS